MNYYTSSTEFNCGIDLHDSQMYVCVMDRQGKKLVHTNVKDNDLAFFLKLVQPYRHELTVSELCALYFSRTLLESLSGTPFRDDVESAFEKLSSTFGAPPLNLRSARLA